MSHASFAALGRVWLVAYSMAQETRYAISDVHRARLAGQRCAALALVFLCLPLVSAAVEFGPQGVVRQFCQADGLGARTAIQEWPVIAPLVEWSLEPAWDHVVLITSYTVGPPKPRDGGALVVDVAYNVVGQVSATGFDAAAQVETLTFQVHAPGERGWRIIGPPAPPHVFGNRVDIETTRRSFELGGFNFVANSTFVWQMFRSAGWNVPFERTADVLNGTTYRVVDHARVGDVIVYLRDGDPIHMGILEAENQVVSSTLNGGVVRTSPDVFGSEVRYLRLLQPEPTQTPAVPTPTPTVGTARPRAPTTHHLRHARTPTPAQRKRKTKPRARARGAQPSDRRRVTSNGKLTPQPRHPTPAAQSKAR